MIRIAAGWASAAGGIGQFHREGSGTGAVNPWQDWAPVRSSQFPQLTPLAAIARNADHVDLFGVSGDGHVWTAWWASGTGWEGWTPIGSGVFNQNTPVAAIARVEKYALTETGAYVDLLAVGEDGRAYTTEWQDGGGWSDWTPIGSGVFTGLTPVGAVARDASDVDAFAV